MNDNVFLKELNKLILRYPKLPDHILDSENCDFCDYVFWSKNLIGSFADSKCSDSIYLFDSILCANCLDCDYGAECQLCYESDNPFSCFNCDFLSDCARLQNSAYCYACSDCHDLFVCTHLKNKSFCILNRQFSEEEYNKEIKKLKSLPSEKMLKMLEELELKYPRTQTFEGNNQNSEYANYIYQCKNCYLCFDVYRDEDCAYLFDSANNSNCFDFTYSYQSSLSYEIVDSDKMFNSDFSVYSSNCRDSQYLFSCKDCEFCLGCVCLNHKKYCILNRQLTKEEYEKNSSQILVNLREQNLGWDNLNF